MVTPLQVQGYSLRIFCADCRKPVRVWPHGTHVTVAGLILAEQQHKAAAHPEQPDLSRVADGYYENGLG